MKHRANNLTKRIFNNFLEGLLYVAPIGATIFIIYVTFHFIDSNTNDLFEQLFGLRIPGLGIVVTITIITLIGAFGKTILAKPMISVLDSIFEKLPLIKVIYTSTKDFMEAFVGQKKKFSEAVLVKMNKDTDIYKLGFITQKDLTHMGIKNGYVAVYLPHSYNFSGNLFVVPSENVVPINASSTEMMKFIVSGGITEVNLKIENEDAKDSNNQR